jgi:hypothetical protein
MAPPKKIRENAKRNASPRAVSDPAESEQLGSLKGERADWSKPFCTGLVKALRPTTPIRNALKSATPIAPPSDRKRSRHAMPTPVSSRRRAFCTATEIGEIWNPHASPRRPVVVTSNKGENPRPVSPIATQAKAAVAAVVIPLNYQLVLGLSPGSTGLRMIPLTSGERSGRTASVSTVLRQDSPKPRPPSH